MQSIKRLLESSARREAVCDEHGPYVSRYIEAVSDWTTCPVCARLHAQQRVRQHLQDVRSAAYRSQDAASSSLQATSGLQGRLSRASMRDLVSDQPARQAIYERLHRYVKRWRIIAERGIWALFAGGMGCGKTYAMAAMARALLDEGVARVLMLRASDVIERALHERGSAAKARHEWFVEPDFVFIDECTPQSCEHPAFFDAVDMRYIMSKPIVFAGNAAVGRDSDIMVARCVLGDRIADRLFDNGGQVLRFTWASLRMKEQDKVF